MLKSFFISCICFVIAGSAFSQDSVTVHLRGRVVLSENVPAVNFKLQLRDLYKEVLATSTDSAGYFNVDVTSATLKDWYDFMVYHGGYFQSAYCGALGDFVNANFLIRLKTANTIVTRTDFIRTTPCTWRIPITKPDITFYHQDNLRNVSTNYSYIKFVPNGSR